MKIKKAVMALNDFGVYTVIALNEYPIGILGEFICHFYKNDGIIEWAQSPLNIYPGVDPQFPFAGHSEIWFEKIENNIQMIISWDSDFEVEPDKSPLLIPANQFVYIVKEWLKLIKLRKPYILITEENNKYSIAAFDENPVPEPMDWRKQDA